MKLTAVRIDPSNMIGAAEDAETIFSLNTQPSPTSQRALKQSEIPNLMPIVCGDRPTISVKKKAKIRTLDRPTKLFEKWAAP